MTTHAQRGALSKTSFHREFFSILLFLSAFSYGMQSHGHSTPAEFAELSLQDLFDQTIDDEGQSDFEKADRWSLSYQLNHIEIEGYKKGNTNLSNNEVLWDNISGEARTDENFPVLPTQIHQNVQLFNAAYRLTQKTNLQVSAPYILQSTDHISIVPGYDNFVIDSKGLGDTTLTLSHNIAKTESTQLRISAGISLPTGSIDETGDTPRAAGNQQLPYTMQLGSGTFDFPLGVTYSSTLKANLWSLTASTKIRTGKNDRNYRLGNSYLLSSRYEILRISPRLKPFFNIDLQYVERIYGQDDEITVPNPNFPYPASITNPNLFGGIKSTASIGIKTPIGSKSKQALVIDLGIPIYQNLNGPQPKANWRGGLKYVVEF